MNLAELLHASAARHANRPGVTDVRSGRSLSYGQLAREAERVATFLIAQGVEPGQRIGLVAPNALAYLPAAFGLLATGACLTPLASHLTQAETAQIMTEVQVNGCLSWPKAARLSAREGGVIMSGGECDGFTFWWTDRGAQGPTEFRQLNPAFVRFTSGTTASSKGVVLSHEATAARVQAADSVLSFSEEDRVLWVLPLAYHFAVTIVAYVRAGAHILVCPDTLPRTLVDSVRRLQPSVVSAYHTRWRLGEHIKRDGWFLTGDIGWLDEGGALYLKSRKKAVIFVAGLKFFPEEVEDCINRFPGIQESRVFARSHARLGEVPCAEVVLDSSGCDLDALRAYCARVLSPYKVPLEFTVVAAVPRTLGGKILRRSVRTEEAQLSVERP